MKKIYLALLCMASLSLMTACSGEKKGGDVDAEPQDEEAVTADAEPADAADAAEGAEADAPEVWGDPAKAPIVDLAALYEAGDFKPAVNTLFVDTLGGETAGELPSKWDIKEGSAEVGEAQGHKFITMLGGTTVLQPKAGDKSFLPDVYTLEFEFMFGRDVWFNVNFFDAEDNGVGDYRMWLCAADWNMAKTNDECINGGQGDLDRMLNRDGWNHFAVSYNKGNMKLFVNGKRIANLPDIKQAAYFVIRGDDATGQSHYIKNIRLAK